MLESRPSPSPGALVGYSLMAALVLLDLGLVLLLINEPVTLLSFFWGALLLISFPAVGFIAYWTSSLSSTRYHVAGDTLVIEWGRFRQTVPLAKIQSLVMGETMGKLYGFRGVRWPGYLVGHGYVSSGDSGEADRKTIFYATRPLQQQLLLWTDTVAYGLSPEDLSNFADCLQALRTPELTSSSEMPLSELGFLDWRIWSDRAALLTLSAAVVLNGMLFAYLSLIYGRLPAQVPLHFDNFGTVDRLASPASLFLLPLLGLFSWVLNGALGWILYQWHSERPPALVLWGSAVLVQVTTWAALLGLLS
jgi:hypothetical protein